MIEKRKFSEEHRKKLSETKKGEHNPFFGKKHSKKTIDKISGENSVHWKGEKASYTAIHLWVNYHKEKTGICTICNETKKTEWANTNHKYKRSLDNYFEVCKSCHDSYDKERGLK